MISSTFVHDQSCVKFMLRQLQEENLFTKADVLHYIGSRFRVKLGLPDWYTDSECAQHLFKYCLLAHLNTETEKFNLLVFVGFLIPNFPLNAASTNSRVFVFLFLFSSFMLRKLYTLVHMNGCRPDDPDSPMMQEILLPGHLYLGVLAVRAI